MDFQFTNHYTREEARALLPYVRKWLQSLQLFRQRLQEHEEHLSALLAQGKDLGGPAVNHWVRTLADMKKVLAEFRKREILIKDLDRGLVDFPAFIGGEEAFLCWEQDEEDIEYWHTLSEGFSGRQPL